MSQFWCISVLEDCFDIILANIADPDEIKCKMLQGAFCNTFDLHKAIISLENQFWSFESGRGAFRNTFDLHKATICHYKIFVLSISNGSFTQVFVYVVLSRFKSDFRKGRNSLSMKELSHTRTKTTSFAFKPVSNIMYKFTCACSVCEDSN